jgi:hypothetical protein
MQERIDRLEGLVKTLMAQDQERSSVRSSPPSNNPSGNQSNASKDSGDALNLADGAYNRTVVRGDHSIYKNANDWSAMLQEVSSFYIVHSDI